jgi:DNA mismatch repair protein MutS2
MMVPADVEQKLGFDQLRQRLSSYCLSGQGLREVEKIHFSSDFEKIKPQLLQTSEFKQILEKSEPFPAQHYLDAEALLRTAAIDGSFLEAEELLRIALSLQVVLECKAFLKKGAETYPQLHLLSTPVVLSRGVPDGILSKLDEAGKVKDNASPDLSRIRKQVREEQHRVRKMLEQVFRQAVSQGWVPEGVSATVRDGRVVIPVLAEHKRKLRGFIMDESATGQTIYIEPAEVLEMNNEIKDLEHAERREVVKVLKQLTSLLRENLDAVQEAYHFLGQLELVRAKAKLAIDLDAELPRLEDRPDLNWLQARHPLLSLSLKGKREVVPLTIDLTGEDPFLLISGPNAGGKSVCLKTVGLIQYMAQCGLLVPLHDKSTVGIFSSIFLDIGDQQSIENDLSTYSSHLRNMAYFITHATESSLILLDELGSGTDPNFGGGIAQAVLAALLEKKAWGVATTHYYNLKLFAENHPGVRNGAMLFDIHKLVPLFRLEIGRPGSSFALEIARKTGLPASTIESAEQIIGKDLTGLDSLMKSVAEEKQSLKTDKVELARKEKWVAEELAKYQKLSAELEGRKKDIINSAKSEASYLLKETNREIEKTIRHILENKAEKKETRKARQSLKAHTEKVQPTEVKSLRTKEEFREGDQVRILGQEVSGTVISVKGKRVVVEFGDLRSTLSTEELVRSERLDTKPGVRKAGSFGIDLNRRQSQFENTLDVRGKRVEEVMPMLERFLDDALLLGQPELRILHGKGEGILRKVVRERLKAMKQVHSIKDEHVERGGDGITVVVLK